MEPIRFPIRSSPRTQEEKVCQTLIDSLDALYSTAQYLTRGPEIAQDLVQETARKALERFRTLQRDQNLRAWLFRILINTVRDHLRHKKLWVETEIEVEPEELSAGTFSMATAVDVQNALSNLSPPARAVILLIDVEGFTVCETASILGIPPGTVCSRLARARSQLREHLQMYRGRVTEQGGGL